MTLKVVLFTYQTNLDISRKKRDEEKLERLIYYDF